MHDEDIRNARVSLAQLDRPISDGLDALTAPEGESLASMADRIQASFAKSVEVRKQQLECSASIGSRLPRTMVWMAPP